MTASVKRKRGLQQISIKSRKFSANEKTEISNIADLLCFTFDKKQGPVSEFRSYLYTNLKLFLTPFYHYQCRDLYYASQYEMLLYLG